MGGSAQYGLDADAEGSAGREAGRAEDAVADCVGQAGLRDSVLRGRADSQRSAAVGTGAVRWLRTPGSGAVRWEGWAGGEGIFGRGGADAGTPVGDCPLITGARA